MNTNDIDVFYNLYKNGIGFTEKIERKLLKESYSFEKWYETLLVKSQKIREYFQYNENAYEEVIGSLVRNPQQLTKEIAEQFLTHIDFFLTEGYRDFGVTVPVLRVLLPYYREQQDIDRNLDAAFFMGLCCDNERMYLEACGYYTEAFSLYEKIADCKEDYRKYRIMCAAYFRLMSYVGTDFVEDSVLTSYYKDAMEVWTKDVPQRILSEKKGRAIRTIIRTITCYGIDILMEQGKEPSPELVNVLNEEYIHQISQINRNQDTKGPLRYSDYWHSHQSMDLMINILFHKRLYATGAISEATYLGIIMKRFHEEMERFSIRFSFGEWNFVALFDDELEDEIFEIDKLFYMNPSFAFMNLLIPEVLAHSKDAEVKRQVFTAINRYFLQLPHISGDGTADVLLSNVLTKVLKYYDDEEEMIECIQNLMVHRQMQTAIHSTMVGLLCCKITEHLIEIHPELFIGLTETKTIEDVHERTEEIIDFAWKSGLCHDVGKLACSDVINLQIRKILDEEFAVIKTHPGLSYHMLIQNKALEKYAIVALEHHRFYDEKSGYPKMDQRRQKMLQDAITKEECTISAMKVMTHIVMISDSIDAATDNLGRNYNKAKDVETVLAELKEQGGVRYSDLIVNAMREDELLIEEIEELITKKRAKVQYDIYRKYIVPDTHFMPDDERFIRQMDQKDLPSVGSVLDILPEEAARYFDDNTRDYAYIILDGKKRIYGGVFCKIMEADALEIAHIYVQPEYRRQGYGSMLLEHVEKTARRDSYKRLYIQDIRKGHYDKFGWRNGYHQSEKLGYLEKSI